MKMKKKNELKRHLFCQKQKKKLKTIINQFKQKLNQKLFKFLCYECCFEHN